MNFKKLLDLFEAPANLNYKGTTGTQAIQQATNQAKPGAIKNVNVIKPGQQLTLPGQTTPYTVKKGDTLDAIAKRNATSTTPSVTTASGPAAIAPEPPSASLDASKKAAISGSPAIAATAATPDTRGAAAMASTSAAPVAASAPANPAEEIVDTPAPADTRGAAAMASKSATPAPVQTASAPAPTDTDDSISPARRLYGYVSEEDEELNELMRLSGRTVNEKAVSKQQQKFMGMVHAMQKGERVKGASPELKKVAKTMNKKDARDFASTKHKGLPSKVTEAVMLEAGTALEHIINKFKHETKNFLAGDQLDNDLYEALFDYYMDAGDIPYGIAKGREGDPYQWVDNKFENDLAMLGHQRDFNMLENLNYDHELTELARLAGLKEAQPASPGAAAPHAPRERERVVSPKVDKFDKEKEAAEKGRRDIIDRESPDANTFGRKVGQAVAKPIAAVKSAWHGATDAWDHEMGNDTYPDPKPPVSVVKKGEWKGDKDNPALKECGDMGMDSQQDSMNISTNMSSDGNKSVTVTAQGDQAAALIDMLRLAGMNSDHVAHGHEPEIVMVSSDDEEMMDEDRVTQYANTPEEEYETVDAITRQGNDLNREKRQFAGKPKLGDNPMAESLLDADLDAMLESILIREEDSAAKKVGDAVKNPGDAAKDVGDKVKGRLSFTKDAEGKTSVKSSTGRIRATLDGNKTHYEPGEPIEKEKTDEGVLDDVSDFVGDIVGTEASKLRHSQQLRDLDTMRKQYKGTPYEKQVNDRYQTHLDRLQGDKGEVVDKKGEPIKVLPPDQWKGSN
jgi:LysM repeat protein